MFDHVHLVVAFVKICLWIFLDVVWTEPSQLLVAYSGGHLATLDLETGQVVSNFQGWFL